MPDTLSYQCRVEATTVCRGLVSSGETRWLPLEPDLSTDEIVADSKLGMEISQPSFRQSGSRQETFRVQSLAQSDLLQRRQSFSARNGAASLPLLGVRQS